MSIETLQAAANVSLATVAGSALPNDVPTTNTPFIAASTVITTSTAVTILAAQGSTTSAYVNKMWIVNTTAGENCTIGLLQGSTTIGYFVPMRSQTTAIYGMASGPETFYPPIEFANTTIAALALTTTGDTYVTVTGYKGAQSS